jgi:hypothetical protein
MSLINRKYYGPPTNFSSKPTSQLKTTYNTVSFHRQYAYGTHHQPALLCHASPWINLKLWPKVTNSKSHLFFCTVYIHVIFYAYFENYLVCSRWCIIISIDGTSYKVEVEVEVPINQCTLAWPHHITKRDGLSSSNWFNPVTSYWRVSKVGDHVFMLSYYVCLRSHCDVQYDFHIQ